MTTDKLDKCPKCRGVHIVKHGKVTTLRGRIQRLKCQSCATTFYKKKEGINEKD